MITADFNYLLTPELIAQTPAPQRDQSRLLVLHRDTGQVAHKSFRDILEYFRPGDVLVLNNSRVIPARLRGVNAKTGGAFEILLLDENAPNDWWAMVRPGKCARPGTQIRLDEKVYAAILAWNEAGHRRLKFSGAENILTELDRLGEMPLPPYIQRDAPQPEDRDRYQTIFAQPPGSVAAPTAGLHFTEAMLANLRERGVQICFVTLHVGPGTFTPVKAETLAAHTMHEERFELSSETARVINDAKRDGRRVIAVGTTSVRVLESVAMLGVPPSGGQKLSTAEPPKGGTPSGGDITAASGRTRIFIHPPYSFKIVDALLTNFHLPCSTLLMLVSAFAAPGEMRGRKMILAAYAEAVRERYRFFSYGDAMLIL